MNSEQFTYWLQGFFELSGSTTLTDSQVLAIKDHLKLVFTKVTPETSKYILTDKELKDIVKEFKVEDEIGTSTGPLPWTPGYNPLIQLPCCIPHTITCSAEQDGNQSSKHDLTTYC
jgi:hypothetical protein